MCEGEGVFVDVDHRCVQIIGAHRGKGACADADQEQGRVCVQIPIKSRGGCVCRCRSLVPTGRRGRGQMKIIGAYREEGAWVDTDH